MSSLANDRDFVFSGLFNSQYINELYDEDYALIEETFGDVVKEYGPLLAEVYLCYRSGDMNALRGSVHKLKPLLGYVGLTTLQSECQQFENNCQREVFPSLHDDFATLSTSLSAAKTLIEDEKARLVEFLSSGM